MDDRVEGRRWRKTIQGITQKQNDDSDSWLLKRNRKDIDFEQFMLKEFYVFVLNFENSNVLYLFKAQIYLQVFVV
jgi:hypothetical protein